jgi:RNA polymerase sigma-70 factor (ECF subfamily)
MQPDTDRDAFADIVRQHQSMVFSIASHFLRNDGAAEELAQEVFLELHRALPSLDSPAHVTNWLRRVTSHRCIDYARRTANRPALTLEDVPEPSAPSLFGDPMLSERIRKLTAALPEKARAVMVLRFQEDLEPAEIAGVLEMPVNTVKSHLQRSIAMLRAQLERAKVRI